MRITPSFQLPAIKLGLVENRPRSGIPIPMQLGRKNRVFVTGGTGLLGSHLIRQLLEKGASVVALVRDKTPQSLFFDPNPKWDLTSRVITVHGEVEDLPLLCRTLNEYEIDTVFHLAAQTIVGIANKNPLSTFKSNIEGTWNLLEACRLVGPSVNRIVIASSDKAYGNLKGDSYDESYPLKGEHPYDVSKSCADLISQAYFTSYQLPICITRCGNFFGPGDLNFNRLVPGTIRQIIQNEPPIIRSNGTYIRDYIFVEDGAQAYIDLAEKMLEKNLKGEAFNFSYGLRLTALQVVDEILTLMSRTELKPIILNEAPNEIPVQCLNSSKARERLGWKPRFGFTEGLRQTVDWYQTTLGNL